MSYVFNRAGSDDTVMTVMTQMMQLVRSDVHTWCIFLTESTSISLQPAMDGVAAKT